MLSRQICYSMYDCPLWCWTMFQTFLKFVQVNLFSYIRFCSVVKDCVRFSNSILLMTLNRKSTGLKPFFGKRSWVTALSYISHSQLLTLRLSHNINKFRNMTIHLVSAVCSASLGIFDAVSVSIGNSREQRPQLTSYIGFWQHIAPNLKKNIVHLL